MREIFACVGIAFFLCYAIPKAVVFFGPVTMFGLSFIFALFAVRLLLILEMHLRVKLLSAEIDGFAKNVEAVSREVDELMREDIVERIDEISAWDEKELTDYRDVLSDENRVLLDSLLQERGEG